MWFVMQTSDPGDRAGCPLPILCLRELHPEAESWGQRGWICSFTHWRVLQGCQSAGSVFTSAFSPECFSICSLVQLCWNRHTFKNTFLDAIKNIELRGPSDYEVSQDSSLAFHVDGRWVSFGATASSQSDTDLMSVADFSPPIWVCWHFLPKCVPDPEGSCTLTVLYANTLRLNHTFTSTGVHCLDLVVRNDISKLQMSFSLSVKRSSE